MRRSDEDDKRLRMLIFIAIILGLMADESRPNVFGSRPIAPTMFMRNTPPSAGTTPSVILSPKTKDDIRTETRLVSEVLSGQQSGEARPASTM
jgi:hypothetical protein